MISFLKQKIGLFMLGLLVVLGCSIPSVSLVEAAAAQFERDFSSHLSEYVLDFSVNSDKSLRENIIKIFYPNVEGKSIYPIIRDITLGVMIVFFVWAGASLLLNKKPEEARKHLYSLLYIMLGGILVYGSSRLFGSVFKFNGDAFTQTVDGTGLKGFSRALIGDVAFLVLSTIKAVAFFLAIIMVVVTGFKVMAAGEDEKGKKLVKGLINVVVALLVIKGVDFIYYLAADSTNFVVNASNFIINVAKVFGWIYGVITVIMVIVAGYLYITDGGTGSNFKKASNLLINILLSALVLFSFLLITYQIFAEFQTGGDAVTPQETPSPTTFLIIEKNYV